MNHHYNALFEVTGRAGVKAPETACMGWDGLQTLSPGQCLSDDVVDIYIDIAARRRRDCTNEDVRMVQCHLMRTWQMWAERGGSHKVPRTGRNSDTEPPTSLLKTDFRGAQCIMWAWHQQAHYSTVFISNAGGVSGLPRITTVVTYPCINERKRWLCRCYIGSEA